MTVVLMYHDVAPLDEFDETGFPGAPAGRYKLDLEHFRAHLDAIEATGAQVGPVTPEFKPDVALSFDDGGRSSLAIAGLLEERGWLGHFFVTTNLIGQPGFLDPDGVVELAGRGHFVGSHSHTHPHYMGKLNEAAIRQEWLVSREVLGQLLGEEPLEASIPGGFGSPAVVEGAVEAGYKILMTSEPVTKVQVERQLEVFGRYAIWTSTSPRVAAAYAAGRGWSRGRLWSEWRVKRTLRGMSPAIYEVARKVRARASDPRE